MGTRLGTVQEKSRSTLWKPVRAFGAYSGSPSGSQSFLPARRESPRQCVYGVGSLECLNRNELEASVLANQRGLRGSSLVRVDSRIYMRSYCVFGVRPRVG
jgi:hypothetical protein